MRCQPYPLAFRKGLFLSVDLLGVLPVLAVRLGVFLLVLLSSSVCRMLAFCSKIVLCALRAAIVSSNSSRTLSGITPVQYGNIVKKLKHVTTKSIIIFLILYCTPGIRGTPEVCEALGLHEAPKIRGAPWVSKVSRVCETARSVEPLRSEDSFGFQGPSRV